jgi:hypothetical protein
LLYCERSNFAPLPDAKRSALAQGVAAKCLVFLEISIRFGVRKGWGSGS